MRKKHWLRTLLIVLVIIAVPTAVVVCVKAYEDRYRAPATRGTEHVYDYLGTVSIGGKTYRRRPGIETILLIGVDKPAQSDSAASPGFRRGGQADFLWLLVIDPVNKKVSHLQIDRDTVTPIKVINVQGKANGTMPQQIALAHSYGDGGKQSCKLTADAVSTLLYNAPIDQYIAMGLDGVPVLNDAVGGVTVTLEQDLSAIDPAMVKGATITLRGDQAETYLRSRKSVGSGSNEDRMDRQRNYISRLTEKLRVLVAGDKNFAGELFDKLEPYLTTSMSRGRVINDTWAAKDFFHDYIRIPGEHSTDNLGYVKFTPDSDALRQIVTNLFYEELR